MKKTYEDLTGQKYNMLTAMYRTDDHISSSGTHSIMWHCKCDCGKECDIKAYSLKTGKTKSCGCFQNSNEIRTKVALRRSGSVAEKYPSLLIEWDYNKNEKQPDEVPCGSDYKAWWVCEKCGNEYQTRVSHRVNNHACPYCSNPPQRIKKGFNDLETFCEKNNLYFLMDEWDYNKNTFSPDHYAPKSNNSVYWICPFGHSYKMQINHRVGKRSQCPICNNEKKTSFAEQAILYYLSTIYKNVENRNNSLIKAELDIYIPSQNTAIEYDGYDWHKNREEKEKRKNELCKEKGIKLIRIREGDLPLYNDCICIVRKDCAKDESLNLVINELMYYLGIKGIDVDVARDSSKIYEQYVFLKKKSNLSIIFPIISQEWHPTKNGQLQPNAFSYSSNKKVWWLCPVGHEYKMAINKRTGNNQGCPICANKKIIVGVNDIDTYCKNNNLQYILDDWDFSKNQEEGINIDSISVGSIIRVWWKCSVCGYEWQSAVNNRIRKKHMCPNCRKNNRPGSKKVINIDTGEVFNSIADAAKSVAVSVTSISSCCRGIGKTAKGFHWRFFDEEKI